ncbi:MBL fold metallo-hydrolase [Streptomyces scabiei]|uniref:MBL fold metallo-hydrolase n=1 Tax=Streptomyces scabiei TaxID=1930 RepID=UPI000D145D24|nr:MBL fold metallo-hydrolase [Streptomyces scabiei]
MLVNDFLQRFSEVWDPAEVDAVVSTHLHTDHVGRNTRLVDGAWVPTFPNARYHFVREEFEFWQDAEGLVPPRLSAGDAAARRGAAESPRTSLTAAPVAYPTRSCQTNEPPIGKPRVKDLQALGRRSCPQHPSHSHCNPHRPTSQQPHPTKPSCQPTTNTAAHTPPRTPTTPATATRVHRAATFTQPFVPLVSHIPIILRPHFPLDYGSSPCAHAPLPPPPP